MSSSKRHYLSTNEKLKILDALKSKSKKHEEIATKIVFAVCYMYFGYKSGPDIRAFFAGPDWALISGLDCIHREAYVGAT